MSIGNMAKVNINSILTDSKNRLDVIYWSKFLIDFNENTPFTIRKMSDIGKLSHDTVAEQVNPKEQYYPFKITYTGNVVLKEPIPYDHLAINKYKIVEINDIVFSRINCCRGSIGIINDNQRYAICTNETHIFQVTDKSVDARYLKYILRHPYYQDMILSQCTGASLERMRFSEEALMNFEIPIPSKKAQLSLIKKLETHEQSIISCQQEIEKLKLNRNKYILSELGIDIVYNNISEDAYPLPITEIESSSGFRLDFEFNKRSFELIKKIHDCKYPLVQIENSDLNTKILAKSITSGSTPSGSVYPSKGIVFLQGKNVDENGLNLDSLTYIPQEFHESNKRSTLVGKEVLVTIAGTIGRVGINHLKDANVNQAIAVLRLNKRMNPLFLSAFLNSDAGKIQFAKHRHDFGTPNINQRELGKLLVPLPDRSIQDFIAKQVTRFEKSIKSKKVKLTKETNKLSEITTEFLLGTKKYVDTFQKNK